MATPAAGRCSRNTRIAPCVRPAGRGRYDKSEWRAHRKTCSRMRVRRLMLMFSRMAAHSTDGSALYHAQNRAIVRTYTYCRDPTIYTPEAPARQIVRQMRPQIYNRLRARVEVAKLARLLTPRTTRVQINRAASTHSMRSPSQLN